MLDPAQAAELLFRVSEVDAAQAVPTRIGPYSIVRKVGTGGMGTVYEAVQESLARTVALKIIHPGQVSESARSRFRFESRALSRLSHPRIATVFDAGFDVVDGTDHQAAFIAMEFIQNGKSIDAYCREHSLTIRARIELIEKVCGALHHAHQRGIIHRDVKPDNILVGADGEPKVIDFGIATLSPTDTPETLCTTLHTEPGNLIGTLQFLSPEQIEEPDLDVRTDVYSLGLVMYQLLTDRFPYDLSDVPLGKAMRLIREAPIPLASTVVGREQGATLLRGNIDAILSTALERRRGRRYQSASDFASDLRAHLENRPIEARPPSNWQRIVRWIGAHPIVTTALACVLVAAVVMITTGTVLWWSLKQPHSLEIDIDQQTVAVISRGRTPITSLPHDPAWSVTEALRVPLDSAWGVLVCDVTSSRELTRGSRRMGRLRVFRPTSLDPDGAIWTLSLDPLLLPRPPHESFRTPGSGDYWSSVICGVADFFPQLPGDELMVELAHTPSFVGALAIIGLDTGTIIHIAWHTGHIFDVAWCPEDRLLVALGVSNRLNWLDLGHSGVDREVHPFVAFAYRPTPEVWGERWLASPRIDTHMTTRWYAAFDDPVLTHELSKFIFDWHSAGSRPWQQDFPIKCGITKDDPETGRNVSLDWELGQDGPTDPSPTVSETYRGFGKRPEEAARSRLVLLSDFAPLGKRESEEDTGLE